MAKRCKNCGVKLKGKKSKKQHACKKQHFMFDVRHVTVVHWHIPSEG